MEVSKLVSPNEMMAAAKEEMLGGREPETETDWELIMNFLAVNIHHEVAMPACKVMAKLYDMPLTDNQIEQIVAFQLDRC